MKITEVRMTTGDWGKTKALASVTFDGMFVVSGIKVVEGSNGFFLGMPSRKNKDGEYKDVCFPISKDFRQELQDAVMEEFNGGQGDDTKAPEYDTSSDDGLPF